MTTPTRDRGRSPTPEGPVGFIDRIWPVWPPLALAFCGACFIIAVGQQLPGLLVPLFVGLMIGVSGTLAVPDRVARFLGWHDADGRIVFACTGWHQRRWVSGELLITSGVALVAVVVFVRGEGGPWTTALLIFLLLPAVIGASLLDVQIDQGEVPAARFVTIFGAGLATAGIADLWVGGGALGALFLFVGLISFRVGFPGSLGRPTQEWTPRNAWLTVAGLVVSGLISLVLLARAWSATDRVGLLITTGLVALVVACTCAVEIGLRGIPGRLGALWHLWFSIVALVGGSLVAAIGSLTAGSALATWPNYSGFLVLLGFLTGVFFVLRGESGFVVLLAGLVITWVTYDRTTTDQPLPEADRIVVGLGDSFMAGQGAHRFFAGNNAALTGDLVDDAWSDCRRSPLSLPHLLAETLNDRQVEEPSPEGTEHDERAVWGGLNLACSGAEIRHLGQEAKYQPRPPDAAASSAESAPVTAGTLTQLAELEQLAEDLPGRVDVVVVSIGGNDAGFGDVIAACLLPADCSEQVEALQSIIVAELAELGPALADVRERVDALWPDHTVDVIVVPYPEFLPRESCGLTASDEEQDAILEFQRMLNWTISDTVGGIDGVDLFNQAPSVYGDDLKLCRDGMRVTVAGANFLHLMPHDPMTGLNPSTWVQGSMHPRPIGHARMAERLADCLQGAQRCRAANLARPNASVPHQGSPGTVTERVAHWIESEVRSTAAKTATALALTVVGGLIFGLGLYQLVHRFARRRWSSWLGDLLPSHDAS